MDMIQEIRSKVTMEEVCKFYGLELNEAKRTRCPFHGGSSRVMAVGDHFEDWHCHFCGEKGDLFDLVAKVCDISREEAVTRVKEDFHILLESEKTPEEKAAELKAWQQLMTVRLGLCRSKARRNKQNCDGLDALIEELWADAAAFKEKYGEKGYITLCVPGQHLTKKKNGHYNFCDGFRPPIE